jgi:hypothetical protein
MTKKNAKENGKRKNSDEGTRKENVDRAKEEVEYRRRRNRMYLNIL